MASSFSGTAEAVPLQRAKYAAFDVAQSAPFDCAQDQTLRVERLEAGERQQQVPHHHPATFDSDAASAACWVRDDRLSAANE